MSKTTTTAWQRVLHGQTTQLDLTNISHYESARIRWRGADNPYIYTVTLNDTGASGATIPSVNGGYSVDYCSGSVSASLYNDSSLYSVTVELRLFIGGVQYGANQTTLSPGGNASIAAGSASLYANLGGQSVSWSLNRISGAGNFSVTSMTVNGYLTESTILQMSTANPTVVIDGETTAHSGTLSNGTTSSWYDLDGLANGNNIILHQFGDSRCAADFQIEYTYQPFLPHTEQELPEHATSTTETTIEFDFILTADVKNDAAKYHARIRFANFSTMPSATVYESKESQAGWNYWDGAAWHPFPSGGVDPDTLVRYTKTFPLSTIYWDTASWDGYSYGLQGTPYKVRLVLTTDSLYTLEIDAVRYNALALRVTEACNGEIGGISMVLDNKDGTTYSTIAYGDTVILAISVNGQDQDFEGVIREINPSGAEVEVTAILGDGILAERIVKEDYNSQDIGLTVKDIIETYCAPLTAANVDTATGFSAPVVSSGKTPLAVLEDIRKQYGIYYYVDKNWDLHFYKTVSDDAILRIARGTV